jgi:protein N-terminal amidase
MRLKVACVQVDPTHGDPRDSMNRADVLLDRLTRDDGVDILLLPEMAHSGYVFSDAKDAERVAETDEGPTVRWCARHARRLQCVVLCGYPRLVPGSGAGDGSRAGDVMYNALCVIGPDGETIAHYHKSFLYVVDKTWATEGDGFLSLCLPVRRSLRASEEGEGGIAPPALDDRAPTTDEFFVSATVAICMDINPREFEAPWEAYELASHVASQRSSLLLFASAWTNNHPDDDPALVTPVDPAEVLQYWLARLAPVIGGDTHFVCANRVGEERGITFVGCSCVMRMKEPALVGMLGPTEEGVWGAELEVPCDEGETREKVDR